VIPEETLTKELKSKYPKVGGTGYCYGGWALFKLGADPQLIDAVSVSHPSLLDKSEIDALKVPVQINAPETDGQLTPELKEYVNKVIPTLNIPYEYVYYPGLVHGFATRANLNDKRQKDGFERAKNVTVNFLKEFLH
jgi:dienelactone hydrolase